MMGCQKAKASAEELPKEWVTRAWLLPAEAALPEVPRTLALQIRDLWSFMFLAPLARLAVFAVHSGCANVVGR